MTRSKSTLAPTSSRSASNSFKANALRHHGSQPSVPKRGSTARQGLSFARYSYTRLTQAPQAPRFLTPHIPRLSVQRHTHLTPHQAVPSQLLWPYCPQSQQLQDTIDLTQNALSYLKTTIQIPQILLQSLTLSSFLAQNFSTLSPSITALPHSHHPMSPAAKLRLDISSAHIQLNQQQNQKQSRFARKSVGFPSHHTTKKLTCGKTVGNMLDSCAV